MTSTSGSQEWCGALKSYTKRLILDQNLSNRVLKQLSGTKSSPSLSSLAPPLPYVAPFPFRLPSLPLTQLYSGLPSGSGADTWPKTHLCAFSLRDKHLETRVRSGQLGQYAETTGTNLRTAVHLSQYLGLHSKKCALLSRLQSIGLRYSMNTKTHAVR